VPLERIVHLGGVRAVVLVELALRSLEHALAALVRLEDPVLLVRGAFVERHGPGHHHRRQALDGCVAVGPLERVNDASARRGVGGREAAREPGRRVGRPRDERLRAGHARRGVGRGSVLGCDTLA